jgi:hypothetical protein
MIHLRPPFPVPGYKLYMLNIMAICLHVSPTVRHENRIYVMSCCVSIVVSFFGLSGSAVFFVLVLWTEHIVINVRKSSCKLSRYFYPILTKHLVGWFSKNSTIQNPMKILRTVELTNVGRQADMTKLTVAFRNCFADEHTNLSGILHCRLEALSNWRRKGKFWVAAFIRWR